MAVEITEFVEIDPDSVHAVFKAANGTPFLMIKQVGDDDAKEKPDGDDDDYQAEKAEFCGDASCEVCIGRAAKGKLSMAERRRIPKTDFAIPDKAPQSGSYPIHDKAHARNALSRVSQHGTPEEKARVRRAVASKFPNIGKGKKKGKKEMAGQQAVEQSGSTPSPDSLQGQTKKNKRGLATNKDVFPKHGKPTIPDAGSINAAGQGFGDTAPDKDIHKDEALTQSREREAAEDGRQSASKEVADMKGDHIDGGTNEEAAADGTQSQTEENMRSKQPGGSDAIRDQMTRQNAQAQKAFKFKVKKGGKKKRKKNAPLLISGAMKQSRPERVLSEALASKEFDDMNGAELAEVMTKALADDRAARKAERKAKKEKRAKKQAKAEKKARKAAGAGATNPGSEEAAQDAAKSISPEKLVEGIGAKVETALKESLAPLLGRIKNIEDQPARPRLAINQTADPKAVLRDQARAGGGNGNAMDVLKPLEDAYKSEKDPYKKEKLGGELTKAKLVIRERIAHGQPVSQADANALAAAGVAAQ